MGEQRLVGGDDVLAGAERRLDRLLGDALLAADQLDEDVDPGSRGERDRIGDEAEAGDVDVAVLAADCAPRRPTISIGRPMRSARSAPALGKEPQDPAADRAEPGEPEFQRLRHVRIRASSSPSTQVE